MDELISKSVKEQLDTAIRNRDVLETESAIKVFEKALGWVKIVGYVFGTILAIVVVLGIWKSTDWWSSVNAAKQAVVDTSTKAQADIAGTAAGTVKTADAISSDLKKTGNSVTAEMDKRAASIQKAFLQSQLQLQAASKLEPEMTAMRKQLAQATTDIDAQQKVISSSEAFVKSVFSSHVTDFFTIVDISAGVRYATIPAPTGGTRSVVFLLLSAAPVSQTLQVQFRIFSQPPNSYLTLNNVVVFFWGEPLDNLKNQQLSASYFPDKTDKFLIHSLTVREGRVFADEEPMPKYGQTDPDFKGNRWLTGEHTSDGYFYKPKEPAAAGKESPGPR